VTDAVENTDTAPETTVETSSPSGPGFGVLLAVLAVAVLAIALLARRL